MNGVCLLQASQQDWDACSFGRKIKTYQLVFFVNLLGNTKFFIV